MERRVTCRNYDPALLSHDAFSAVLYRAFGARAVSDYAPGVQLLKKGAPSAGGLHAIEAYLLVQRVEGIVPGLYHYHPVAHALEPLRDLDTDETRRWRVASSPRRPVTPRRRCRSRWWRASNAISGSTATTRRPTAR